MTKPGFDGPGPASAPEPLLVLVVPLLDEVVPPLEPVEPLLLEVVLPAPELVELPLDVVVLPPELVVPLLELVPTTPELPLPLLVLVPIVLPELPLLPVLPPRPPELVELPVSPPPEAPLLDGEPPPSPVEASPISELAEPPQAPRLTATGSTRMVASTPTRREVPTLVISLKSAVLNMPEAAERCSGIAKQRSSPALTLDIPGLPVGRRDRRSSCSHGVRRSPPTRRLA